MHIGLFLDRDGTINEEVEYLSSSHQVRLIPRAAEAIHEANKLGFKVIGISNQSGVARGMFTEDDVKIVNTTLRTLLEKENAHLDAMYYCPHYPKGERSPYNIECECRKPKIGMLLRAQKEFQLDLTRSFVIGDKISDIQTGNNAGAVSILVLTGYGKNQVNLLTGLNGHAEYIATDLMDALNHIKQLLSSTLLSRSK
ncbi:MAG: D-glycero-alpha-D-manno-heptose-1,7-bisphosphate 7-phosphatase [Bacteroidota bacterium]